jgi:hypothetical protein
MGMAIGWAPSAFTLGFALVANLKIFATTIRAHKKINVYWISLSYMALAYALGLFCAHFAMSKVYRFLFFPFEILWSEWVTTFGDDVLPFMVIGEILLVTVAISLLFLNWVYVPHSHKP